MHKFLDSLASFRGIALLHLNSLRMPLFGIEEGMPIRTRLCRAACKRGVDRLTDRLTDRLPQRDLPSPMAASDAGGLLGIRLSMRLQSLVSTEVVP